MGLVMKAECERCLARLAAAGHAFICSYECTFCPTCAQELGAICPNCSGELVSRPRRLGGATDVPPDTAMATPQPPACPTDAPPCLAAGKPRSAPRRLSS